jgi:hypothetical protein
MTRIEELAAKNVPLRLAMDPRETGKKIDLRHPTRSIEGVLVSMSLLCKSINQNLSGAQTPPGLIILAPGQIRQIVMTRISSLP